MSFTANSCHTVNVSDHTFVGTTRGLRWTHYPRPALFEGPPRPRISLTLKVRGDSLRHSYTSSLSHKSVSRARNFYLFTVWRSTLLETYFPTPTSYSLTTQPDPPSERGVYSVPDPPGVSRIVYEHFLRRKTCIPKWKIIKRLCPTITVQT